VTKAAIDPAADRVIAIAAHRTDPEIAPVVNKLKT